MQLGYFINLTQTFSLIPSGGSFHRFFEVALKKTFSKVLHRGTGRSHKNFQASTDFEESSFARKTFYVGSK